MATTERFRVIIVGGGPVGLTAAHVLGRAGIDFVLLEARDTVTPKSGASLLLYPNTVRIFQQLGIKEAARAVSYPLSNNTIVTPKGKLYHRGTPGRNFERIHGAVPLIFDRQELLEVLYKELPPAHKDRILTGKKVVNTESGSAGVAVHCADGTVEHGSLVLGVDGAHSCIRDMMRDHMLSSGRPATAVHPAKPYKAEYVCIWGCIPTLEGLEHGANLDCHGVERSIMFLTTPQRSWFFLYERLPTPTSERHDYSEKEVEAIAARFAEMHVTPTIKFGDIWPMRMSSGATNLDEGCLDHWGFGRVVLAGDAVHKVTPNIGWGYNLGVQDVVVLVNLLYAALKESSELDVRVLERVWAEYRAGRKADNQGLVLALCAVATRQCARPPGPKGWGYLLLEWLSTVIPSYEYLLTRYLASHMQKTGRVLDFLPGDDSDFCGEVPWKYPLKPVTANGGLKDGQEQ